VTIREATTGDAAALVPLFAELGYPTGREQLEQRLVRLASDATYCSWVHERGSAVVGFAAAHLLYTVEDDIPVAQLIALVSLPKARSHGVGTALVRHFESWAHRKGARRLIISSGLHRSATHQFYERRGYANTGLRFSKTI
jgi:GNAT superfamily N-acetyltransferase